MIKNIVHSFINQMYGFLWNHVRAIGLAITSLPSAYYAFTHGESFESYRGFVDYLTGLLNRRAFDRDLNSMTRVVSVIYMDLDNFRTVNNTLGHLPGDQYLRITAQALTEFTSASGRCYRIGGDEMAVILDPHVDGNSFKVKLMNYIQERYGIPVSIGCAVSEPTAVLRLSETRMYASKNRRKGKEPASSKIMYIPNTTDKRGQIRDRRSDDQSFCMN